MTDVKYYYSTSRIFSIYLIISLFFVIVGLNFFFGTEFWVPILWTLSNIFLLIIIYNFIINLNQSDSDNNILCLVDTNNNCFKSNKNFRSWVIINALYLIILVFTTMWAVEKSQNSELTIPYSIVILILFFILYIFGYPHSSPIIFWVFISNIVVWLFLITFSLQTCS